MDVETRHHYFPAFGSQARVLFVRQYLSKIIIIFVMTKPGSAEMLRYLNQYKFSILLAMVIAMLSLMPDSAMPHSSFFSIRYMDKIVHFSMYAAFGFTALLESRCKLRCRGYHALLLLTILTISAIIEVLQATVVETRAAEWLDMVANAIGLFSGYVAYRLLKYIIS